MVIIILLRTYHTLCYFIIWISQAERGPGMGDKSISAKIKLGRASKNINNQVRTHSRSNFEDNNPEI